MINVTIRDLKQEDKDVFLAAMQCSQALHHPWVQAPTTGKAFDEYYQKSQLPNQKAFLVCDEANEIAGVINLSEIVMGCFQNAYIGFYATADYSSKGYMSAGLKLVLQKAFREMGLHRLEANIQPSNLSSIQLVKKNGFRYEGYSPRYLKINDAWQGHERWAITYEDYIQDDESVQRQDQILQTSYNAAWPSLANNEISAIKAALPADCVLDIQHVGSTAIPGITAKPIIDIQLAVPSLAAMKIIAVPALQKLGYEYWSENPDPGRMFFVKGMPPYGSARTHHVHIVELSSPHWQDKIDFRDYLIAHPQMAEQYSALKLQLTELYRHDREQYAKAKTEFVKNVLVMARQGKQ